jgi:hypothetical protein
MYEVTGDEYMYLTCDVHLVGIKRDCKNVRIWQLEKKSLFYYLDRVIYRKAWVEYKLIKTANVLRDVARRF